MNSSSKHSNPNRRAMLAAGACLALGAGPRAWAQDAPTAKDGRMVVIFLRGALDSMSARVY